MMVFLKQIKWWVLAAIAVAIPALLWIFRSFLTKSLPVDLAPILAVPKAIQDKLNQAHEEALVAKAESKAVTEIHKNKLADIGKIDDGAERRRQLAEMLKTL